MSIIAQLEVSTKPGELHDGFTLYLWPLQLDSFELVSVLLQGRLLLSILGGLIREAGLSR